MYSKFTLGKSEICTDFFLDGGGGANDTFALPSRKLQTINTNTSIEYYKRNIENA